MKILYGINSDGLGHATRSMMIIDHLIKKGHEIHIATGKNTNAFKFLSNRYENVYPIIGLQFIYKDDELREFHSISNIIYKKELPTKNMMICRKLVKTIKPDLIISDFEPSILLQSRLSKIPSISIDNQCSITKTNLEFEAKKLKDYILAQLIINFMSANADRYFGLCFFKNKIRKKNTQIYSPIFRDEVSKQKTKDGDYILVYDRLNANSPELKKALTSIKDEKFMIYCAKENKKYKNIIYKKTNPNLYKDLAKSKAFITKAGHSSISEAILYKKPIYTMPIKHQFEQEVNAYYVEKLGFGMKQKIITIPKLKQFIKRIPEYKNNLKKYKFNNKTTFFRALDKTISELIKEYK